MLQVDWCTLSLSARDPSQRISARAAASGGAAEQAAQHPEHYMLPQGGIIWRKASDLAKLDLFRTQWEDEQGRWSLSEELAASYDR